MTPHHRFTADDLHEANERHELVYGDGMAQVYAAGLVEYPADKVNHAADLYDAEPSSAQFAQLNELADTDPDYREIIHTFERLGVSFRRRVPVRRFADAILGSLPPNQGPTATYVRQAIENKALPEAAVDWTSTQLREWATDTVLHPPGDSQ